MGLATGAAVCAKLRTLSRRLISDDALREKIQNAEARIERRTHKTDEP